MEQKYLVATELPDGRWLAIQQQVYTTGLFVIKDRTGVECRYCYPNLAKALAAMVEWDGKGDPPGPWIKKKPPDMLNPRLADPKADFGEEDL